MFQISSPRCLKLYETRNMSTFDINQKNILGNTLMHIAVISKNTALINCLLEYKDLDLSVMNVENRGPLFYIKDADILEIFLEKIGPTIFTIVDGKGKNILHSENNIVSKMLYSLINR